MKVKMVIDEQKFLVKPQGMEIGIVVKRMTIDKVKEYTIEELKQSILDGRTNRPSNCGGKEDSWKSQQVFMIDIDNDLTIQQAIEICNDMEIVPSFIYTSFSHKEEHHKFRLVFVLDKEITDINIAKKIQLYLMSIFKYADIQCKNLNRIYFAGKNIVFESNNILDSDKLIELSKDINIDITPSKVNNDKGSEKCPHNNNKIYNNSYIIVGTKTQKADGARDTDDNYNIKAISKRDVKYLKNKLNHPHMVFNNNQEFCDYIFKKINLGELLEFKYPKSIRCIFHDDTNNSASIFQNEKGDWIYNCFGCGVSYNLLGVVEVLGKFKSRPKAYRFIREIFNLEIKETEWQKEQKEMLLENMKVINNGELERNCPQAYKNIKSNLKYLNQLLLIAMDNVTNEKMTDDDNNVLFFASTRYICKLMGMKEGSIKEISKKSALMAYHKLLNKVDNSEANGDLLKRSQAISINSEDKNKKYRHVNYYSIPSYNNMLFGDIEQQGKAWKENNYTIKGLSREMFYRAEGKDIADLLYPQYKQVYDKKQETIIDRTTTFRSDKRTNRIVENIMWYLDEMNYCLEKDIICNLVLDDEIRITRSEAERQLKKSLPEILDAYDLKRIRANKKIKEQFGVVSNGYPFIIVKNNDLEVV